MGEPIKPNHVRDSISIDIEQPSLVKEDPNQKWPTKVEYLMIALATILVIILGLIVVSLFLFFSRK